MKALKLAVLGCFMMVFCCGAADTYVGAQAVNMPPYPYVAPDTSRNFDVSLDYTYIGAHINNMPLLIRNEPVPSPDSWAAGNQGPVEQKDYNSDHSIALWLMYAKEFGFDDKNQPRFNVAAGLGWIIYPWVNEQKAERNYTNDPGSDTRGNGAALTYVGVRQVGIIPSFHNAVTDDLLNWAPMVKLEVRPFDGALKNVWFGMSASYYTINAQTGDDRNDSLDPRKDYVLMHVIPIRVYSTFFFEDDKPGVARGGFTIGVQFQPGSKTDLGEQADMSVSPATLFLGYSLRTM